MIFMLNLMESASKRKSVLKDDLLDKFRYLIYCLNQSMPSSPLPSPPLHSPWVEECEKLLRSILDRLRRVRICDREEQIRNKLVLRTPPPEPLHRSEGILRIRILECGKYGEIDKYANDIICIEVEALHFLRVPSFSET